MDKTIAFVGCLVYDLIFTAIILYLIAFKGWSNWTYLLAVMEGFGIAAFYKNVYGIKEVE